MAIQIRFLGTYREGELPLLTTGTPDDFKGGAPVKITADGLALCKGLDAGYIGVALEPRSKLANGEGNASYMPGTCEARLYDNSANESGDTVPFDDGLTYAKGEPLYVDNNGLWSNSTPGTGDVDASAVQRGVVLDVGTDELIVQILGVA